MSNISKAFAEYIENEGFGSFGTSIFIGSMPVTPNKAFLIKSAGGNLDKSNKTGELLKNYVLNIFYRSDDAQDLYEVMQSLEENINSDGCTQLNGFDTINLTTTTFPSDQDVDSEERSIALMQVTIKIYK